MAARLSPDPLDIVSTDTTTQEILLHAAHHNLPALKPLLRVPGAASVQDPETGFTPLHAAIAACGDASDPSDDDADVAGALATVRELLLSGAIWNDLDANDETAACLAWRLGRSELYEVLVEAGVRAEVLLGLMGGYERLSSSGDESDSEEAPELIDGARTEADGGPNGAVQEARAPFDPQNPEDVNSKAYLGSDLTFTPTAILDDAANGVMMAWETAIMELSATLLCPSPGLRVLNIGFGMGIVDGFFGATQPATHHIIEAHAGVLATLAAPTHDFGPAWEARSDARNKVWRGRWQDVVPTLLERGEVYDAIYFDTFGEDYSALKAFFQDFVPGLLAPEGRFGFFNGLGADRRVCYDVYTRVVELDLCDAGMEVQWVDVEVPMEGGQEGLGKEGEGGWEGVRRRYWTLETYRLPVCSFMG